MTLHFSLYYRLYTKEAVWTRFYHLAVAMPNVQVPSTSANVSGSGTPQISVRTECLRLLFNAWLRFLRPSVTPFEHPLLVFPPFYKPATSSQPSSPTVPPHTAESTQWRLEPRLRYTPRLEEAWQQQVVPLIGSRAGGVNKVCLLTLAASNVRERVIR